MEQKSPEIRFRAFGFVLIGILMILTARLWFLQIIRGEENLEKSNRVRTYSIPITAPRGIMYDRNGKPMVDTRLSHTITVIPEDISNHPETVKRLAAIMGMKPEELIDTLAKRVARDRWRKRNEPLKLFRDVSADVAMRIEEARLDLPGVEVTREPVRNYIFSGMASHVFGYIAEISGDELTQMKDQGYRMGDNIGKTGLERTYEKILRGQNGTTEIEVDKLGRIIRTLREVYPASGHNLHLTINLELQQVAEKALADQLEHLRKTTPYKKAQSGAVVVMDPRNGDILAMVSQPTFDPNLFVTGMPAEVSRSLFNDPLHPFTNRALFGQYAPGSTFKPVTVAAALETSKIRSTETFFCGGIDPVSGKRCWVHSTPRGSHGTQNIIDSLKNSCNIAMFDMARKVGVETLAQYSRLFGLGKVTGLDLHPGEKNGLVPDREYKEKRFKGDLAVWRPNETLDFSIGQGFLLTTPLQLAQLYSALANGGTLYAPRLVTGFSNPEGNVYRTVKPKVTGKTGISQSTMNLINQGLVKVVSEGTAAGVFRGFPLNQYPVAGKTGTAQKTGYDNNGWFTAYAPANDPTIVVVVLVEQGGSGSSGAGPIARQILETYFKVPPREVKPAAPVTPAPGTAQPAPDSQPSTDAAAPASNGTIPPPPPPPDEEDVPLD